MKSNCSRHFILGATGALAALGLGMADAQAGPAPCSLLSSAEVSAAVGANVGAAQPIATTGCSWSAPHIIVTVSLWDASKWAKMKAGLPGISTSSVAGLGDDAFFSTMGSAEKQFTTLTVKKGDTAYVIKVYGGSAAEQMSSEKTLAGNVLAKL
jgi:hypothetical protein